MTEFKPGDRVEYQNGIEEDPANGRIGTVLGKSMYSTPSRPRVGVTWGDGSFPALHPLTSHLRPVKPQKATPKAGDIVRVVLEGKVGWNPDADGEFVIRSNNAENWIVPEAEHVKSIEIITPAKPSVADLPVGSVVKLGNGGMAAVRRVQDGAWFATDGDNYSNSEIDAMSWTLLVEAKPE